jgi:hypothetical protein
MLNNSKNYCNLLQFTANTAKYYIVSQKYYKILQDTAKYCKIPRNTAYFLNMFLGFLVYH